MRPLLSARRSVCVVVAGAASGGETGAPAVAALIASPSAGAA
jgi:hypothetical protein